MFGLMRLLATYHRQKNGQREKNIDWKPYWQSHDTKLVHFIGKDNIVFHCIIFPIILKNLGSYVMPENVPANEFLNLEGNKISTSKIGQYGYMNIWRIFQVNKMFYVMS